MLSSDRPWPNLSFTRTHAHAEQVSSYVPSEPVGKSNYVGATAEVRALNPTQ